MKKLDGLPVEIIPIAVKLRKEEREGLGNSPVMIIEPIERNRNDEAEGYNLNDGLIATMVLVDANGVVRFATCTRSEFGLNSILTREVEQVLKEMGHEAELVDPNLKADPDASSFNRQLVYACQGKMVRQVASGGELTDAFLGSLIPTKLNPNLRRELLQQLKPTRALTAVQMGVGKAADYLEEVEQLSSGNQINQLAEDLLQYAKGFALEPKLTEIALRIAKKGIALKPTGRSLNNYAKCLVFFDDDFTEAIEVQIKAIQLKKAELESLQEANPEGSYSIKYLKENEIPDFESYLNELRTQRSTQ